MDYFRTIGLPIALVLFGAAIIVVTVISCTNKKFKDTKKGSEQVYDERQKILKGPAYKIAFIVTAATLGVCALFDGLIVLSGLPFCGPDDICCFFRDYVLQHLLHFQGGFL